MITLHNGAIRADILTIIAELQKDYAVFNTVKQSDYNVQTICPFHKQGKERTPSFGIHRFSGMCHCFTCHFKGSLDYVIGQITGGNGMHWLLRRFAGFERGKRIIELDLEREHGTAVYTSEKELEGYRYTHPYMYKRGFTDKLIERFDIGYDDFKFGGKTIPCITFPVRDLAGRTLFVTRRSTEGKFFHIPMGVEKPLYGLFELDKPVKTLYICEGAIDAITATKYGHSAVALFGLGTLNQMKQINRLGAREIIIALDNDDAGIAASRRIAKNVHGIKKILHLPPKHDINDLTHKEFDSLGTSHVY